MANSITYAEKYLQKLDEIYKASAKTAILEAASDKYNFSQTDEKTIYLQNMTLQGLGNYSRSAGYDSGDATISWNPYTVAIDRSKKFNLDAMDAREAYVTIAKIGAEFERVHVAPELDAYRFEKICTLCGLDVSANLTDDTTLAAIDLGIKTLDDAEVPQEGRVLFISNTVYSYMKQSNEHFNVRISAAPNNGVINRNVQMLDDMPIVRVPTARFHNNFDFTASGAGGFAPAGGSKAINFMIAYAPEIIAVKKHVAPKIIAPELNQTYDGYSYSYRILHDLFIPANKLSGVYIHTVA
jgi:hypothetical protein